MRTSPDADKLVLLIETGLRLQIQESVRFVPAGLEENMKEIRSISAELSQELGFGF
jgi:hypothetical protein